MAYAVQATTHYQTYLERPPGADLHPKKVSNLAPMAPRPQLELTFAFCLDFHPWREKAPERASRAVQSIVSDGWRDTPHE